MKFELITHEHHPIKVSNRVGSIQRSQPRKKYLAIFVILS
jgi:hypothetical protein